MRVMETIPTNRWFFVIPLKIFSSSGFRALNSLKICKPRISTCNE
uniref:Uncharacterized protein MANES_14G162600 n=1 Tax=Rhizophora mucronata TaxID=61149 RepID=A0A2P2MNK6_RHIMU